MGPDSVWEIVFLMVILKIPIVYLCTVVYYAIKAEPRPEAGAGVTARIGPEDVDGITTALRDLHARWQNGGLVQRPLPEAVRQRVSRQARVEDDRGTRPHGTRQRGRE